jgi:hypothetical protein
MSARDGLRIKTAAHKKSHPLNPSLKACSDESDAGYYVQTSAGERDSHDRHWTTRRADVCCFSVVARIRTQRRWIQTCGLRVPLLFKGRCHRVKQSLHR